MLGTFAKHFAVCMHCIFRTHLKNQDFFLVPRFIELGENVKNWKMTKANFFKCPLLIVAASRSVRKKVSRTINPKNFRLVKKDFSRVYKSCCERDARKWNKSTCKMFLVLRQRERLAWNWQIGDLIFMMCVNSWSSDYKFAVFSLVFGTKMSTRISFLSWLMIFSFPLVWKTVPRLLKSLFKVKRILLFYNFQGFGN